MLNGGINQPDVSALLSSRSRELPHAQHLARFLFLQTCWNKVFSTTSILEEFSIKSHVSLKEKLQKNSLMIERSKVSLVKIHSQKIQICRIPQTDM